MALDNFCLAFGGRIWLSRQMCVWAHNAQNCIGNPNMGVQRMNYFLTPDLPHPAPQTPAAGTGIVCAAREELVPQGRPCWVRAVTVAGDTRTSQRI